jgi:CheY-like chemotaxis protein
MGGDVTLESEVGRGSTFHLTLPLDARLTTSSGFAAATGQGGDAGQVLLSVDDDPSVFPLLQKMLIGHGYRVVSTSPGEAVADARRLRPAAILLDILMPERGGGEILAELKEDPVTRPIPVIVLSVVEPEDLVQLATAHLGKPVRQEALLHALSQHVPAPQVDL